VDRHWRTVLLALSVSACLAVFPFSPRAAAQTPTPIPQLKISGAVSTPLTLTLADLKGMPRTTLHVTNPHENKTETYEGVLLEELLRRAGVAQGDQLRGKLMTAYVIAEAEDGYKVVFSLAELDSGITNSEVLVADTVDGAPIDAKRGPFRLVAPHDKRQARWVRMLRSITVSAPKESNWMMEGPEITLLAKSSTLSLVALNQKSDPVHGLGKLTDRNPQTYPANPRTETPNRRKEFINLPPNSRQCFWIMNAPEIHHSHGRVVVREFLPAIQTSDVGSLAIVGSAGQVGWDWPAQCDRRPFMPVGASNNKTKQCP